MDTQYDIVRTVSLESTQDDARDRHEATGRSVLVVAEHQTVGRGRQGREWLEPDRGMFSSFSFRTDWEVEARTLIPLVTAVAVHDAVVDVLGVELGLRWPNDLMVGPDKVGGILVEARDDTVTIGCGMNLYWVEPIQGARGLLDTDPGSDISVVLADSWVQRLVGFLAEESSGWPRREYEAASVSLDHAVSWDGGSGVAAAIADDGALIVETEDGLVVLRAGEVHTR